MIKAALFFVKLISKLLQLSSRKPDIFDSKAHTGYLTRREVAIMAMNRIQFQPGLSLRGFHAQFGTETQCAAALEAERWPEGFRCPHCGGAAYYLLLHLKTLPSRLLVAALATGPRPERWLRLAEESC